MLLVFAVILLTIIFCTKKKKEEIKMDDIDSLGGLSTMNEAAQSVALSQNNSKTEVTPENTTVQSTTWYEGAQSVAITKKE
uniref:Uncharacterized protein n=1 Tax=Panagrolaimus sp. JU765 TaxID=591449 RepID=A0AC34QGL0_9BILA